MSLGVRANTSDGAASRTQRLMQQSAAAVGGVRAPASGTIASGVLGGCEVHRGAAQRSHGMLAVRSVP